MTRYVRWKPKMVSDINTYTINPNRRFVKLGLEIFTAMLGIIRYQLQPSTSSLESATRASLSDVGSGKPCPRFKGALGAALPSINSNL